MSVQEWQLPGYEMLRIKIVQLAVTDYRVALRKSSLTGKKCAKEEELERFFLSRWGQALSGNNGQYIMDKCKAEKYKKRSNADQRPDEEQIKIVEEYRSPTGGCDVCKKYNITQNDLYRYIARWG